MAEPTALRGETLLITGATGFIGRYVGERLIELGVRTFGLSRSASIETLPAGVQPLPIDLRDSTAVREAFERVQPDRVIHLAAVGVLDIGVPLDVAMDINVDGTRHVLETCAAVGVRRVVHVGTAYERAAAAGSGHSYAASKLGAWSFWHAFVQAHALNSVALRVFHVYGPRQPARGLIPAAILAARRGETLKMTPGEQLRDFVYVGDVVEALIAAVSALDCQAQTYDIGTGEGRSVRSVVTQIFERVGGAGRFEAGALPYRPGEVMRLIAQPEAARRELGWQARIAWETGLALTLRAYPPERDNRDSRM
jgi:nucleoside-diphosphate-sugar epimerase